MKYEINVDVAIEVEAADVDLALAAVEQAVAHMANSHAAFNSADVAEWLLVCDEDANAYDVSYDDDSEDEEYAG